MPIHLSDDFEDGVIDAALWVYDPDTVPTAVEADGRLKIPQQDVYSLDQDFRGGWIIVQTAAFPDQGAIEVTSESPDDPMWGIFWTSWNEAVSDYYPAGHRGLTVEGVTDETDVVIADYTYLRFTMAPSHVLVEASPDGATWTTVTDYDIGATSYANLAAGYIYFSGSGQHGGDGGAASMTLELEEVLSDGGAPPPPPPPVAFGALSGGVRRR
jgi:hypothetical protein